MARVVLVTGGAGFVGSHAVAALLEQDAQRRLSVVVVDNLSNAHIEHNQSMPESLRRVEKLTGRNIAFYKTDIQDKSALHAVFQKHEVWGVIHFAALKAVGESVRRPLEYYQNNIGGMCALLEVMRAHGVYNLIYSSSCTVYGEPERLPIAEGHAAGRQLTSPYGKSKFFCEEIARDLCASDLETDKKWSVVSLRYFNPVGAHRSGRIGEDPNGLPNNLMPYISQVAVGKLQELQVFGSDYDTPDGTGVRDYIHVMDLADGHVKAMQLFDAGEKGFVTINLGTGTGYSVLQVIKAFETASGKKVPYRVVGRRSGDTASTYADASLAQQLLGWKATRSLEEMCRDTWNWQSQNPKGYSDNLI